MKYQHKENRILATLVSENEKFKTVDLELSDGTMKQITTSTLKRWWKAIPEEETTEQETKTSNDISNDIAADFEAQEKEEEETEKEEPKMVPMPGTEGEWGKEHYAPEEESTPEQQTAEEQEEPVAEQKVKGKKKRNRVKKSSANPELVDSIAKFLDEQNEELGGTTYIRPTQQNRVHFKLKEGGAVYMYYICQKSSVSLRMKSKLLDEEMISRCGNIKGSLFDCTFKIDNLDEDTKQFIIDVVKMSNEKYKKTLNNTKKTEKEEK